MSGMTYSGAGVDAAQAARETGALGRILAQTAAFRTDAGRSVLENGYYASAVRINDELALGICTDGVGSKILVAEMMDRYDTIGIDCIAMNVNDLICIGAEPLCLVDYVGVEHLHEGMLEQVAKGLLEGARQARITIPGGETAQLPEMIRGAKAGTGLDLVGTAVGLLPMERLNCGKDVKPGDVVIGVPSSGIHSNGYTLARRVLFEKAGFAVDTHREELGGLVGDAMLEPTRIYVQDVMALFGLGIDVKALCHITGDGLLNLNRVHANVGWVIDTLPATPPIFDLIQREGKVETAEMFAVFNMGIGLCAVVAEADADSTCEILGGQVIGRAVADPANTVQLTQYGLTGTGTSFRAVS